MKSNDANFYHAGIIYVTWANYTHTPTAKSSVVAEKPRDAIQYLVMSLRTKATSCPIVILQTYKSFGILSIKYDTFIPILTSYDF